MATLMTALTSPEAGYRRVENTDISYTYVGSWTNSTAGLPSGGSAHNSTTAGVATIRFNAVTDKIRIIATAQNNFNNNISIKIDGVTETFSEFNATTIYQCLVYEKTGLEFKEHTVEISGTVATNAYMSFDAVDVADTGSVKSYNFFAPSAKSSLVDINVLGDAISCEYTSVASGLTGMFANLGVATKDAIPMSGTATPNGSFNFAYVGNDYFGRKLLVADRNIQHTMQWRLLNHAGIATPNGIDFKKHLNYSPLIPIMTATTQDGITVSSDGVSPTSGTVLSVFDGNYATYITQPATLPSGSTKHFIKVDFGIQRTVNAIMKSSAYQVYSGYYGIKNWVLYGSNDDVDYTEIVAGTQSNTLDREFDEFNNTIAYRYYKFECDSWYSAMISITDLQLYAKNDIDPFPGHNITIRLLKKAEYEKFIIKSTLNGKIVAGDTSVWNHGASLSSWLLDGYGNYRLVYGTASNTNSPSSAAAAYGLRPVLVIEDTYTPISTAFRIVVQDGNDNATSPIKIYNTTTNVWDILTGVSIDNITPADFNDFGMDITTYNLIPGTAWDLLDIDAQIRAYSPMGTSRNATTTYVPEDKIVLMQTDYTFPLMANVDNITLTANTNGNTNLKIILSVDSGVTWYTWDGAIWSSLTPTVSNVLNFGMSVTTFNSINNELLGILGTDRKIRFGYAMSITDSTDILEVDSLNYQYDGYGKWKQAIIGTEYDLTHELHQATVDIYIDGDFKINYLV